jgi:hypothetical protein
MKKNVLGLMLVAAGCIGGLAGCKKDNAGKVINIWCWNNEFQSRFNAYYPDIDTTKGDKGIDGTKTYLKDGYTVNFIIHANDNNGYQTPLDAQLKAEGDDVSSDKKDDSKIDMFLLEADYATKYVNSDYTLPVSELGITDADTAQMYDYTKTVATDTRAGKNKALKALSWQATPGLFAYRTDIAQAVWKDYPADPAESDSAEVKATKTAAQAEFVQAKMADWDKFDAVAKEMHDHKYLMVSGFDDMYRVFSNNATKSWYNGEKIYVDSEIKKWVKKTADYKDKGYCGTSKLWDNQWAADQGGSKKTITDEKDAKNNATGKDVFGFFYSTWGINFTLEGNSLADSKAEKKLGNGLYGKYRVVKGPASWYWGGTWMAAARGTDNKDKVADIMKKLTCDKSIAKKITIDTQDYTNNKAAMNEIANDPSFGSAFLGGQNHIKLFAENAANIRLAPLSDFDQGCNEKFQNAMRSKYFLSETRSGSADAAAYKAAIQEFKTNLNQTYSGLEYDPSDEQL